MPIASRVHSRVLFRPARGRPLLRNRHAKLAHRAMIWGVYVVPKARGQGVCAAIIGGARLDAP